ncbi:apolipoprotein N-acyltransferase [Robertkochia aurantiaca]|uniref:apolipoprotein N-acyltransferase n=1 Tax=Robertkochia aurantiaca TaxID=2873700 RepID=UPI001CCE5C03|nr:apolipoprotein N-acyltransferase [Robertkochia sp. 3YJGBD-33]
MKNNYLLALLSGCLLAVSWPTYGIPLFAFIGFVPLLLAERRIRTSNLHRRGFKVFLSTYLGLLIWNSVTTWWIWYSTPFGMFFALLVNTLLMTFIFMLYHFVARRLPQKIHLVFLPAIWIAFEKFHLNWDFSWPWLNLGNVFSEYISWIQWYEYTGTFGGALWIWIINIGIFRTVVKARENKNRRVLTIGVARNVMGIAIPIILSMFLFYNYQPSEEKAEVIVVQPNIDPYTEKYDRSNVEYARLIDEMTRDAIDEETDYIVAPETVLAQNSSIDLFDSSREKKILQSVIAPYPGLHLILGADFHRFYNSINKPTSTANAFQDGRWYDVYNAAVQIDGSTVSPKYIKSKLVVGVENFPFKSALEPLLGDIMLNLGGTVASRAVQPERSVFQSKDQNYAAAPIICYESVYGEYVTEYVSKGANFLAIITNDAWWSDTQGHQQHLSYARLRAIENRRSVVRSANTGISALIDERGQLIKTLGYEKQGILKGDITINNDRTFYVRYGDYIARLSVLIAGMVLLFAIARKKQ